MLHHRELAKIYAICTTFDFNICFYREKKGNIIVTLSGTIHLI